MSTKTVTTFLLSSLIYSTTHAFVPLDIHPPIDNNAIQPLPSDLDTLRWIPIATLEPISNTPYPASSVPTPTPSLENKNEYHILPLGLDANAVPDLKVRQVTGQGAPAAASTAISQVSPITTYYINSVIAAGEVTQVPVVYTQTFVPVPDQWSSAGAGTIGLGTISGTVGQVRSKRSLPTQAPLAEDNPLKEGSETSNAGSGPVQETASWTEKLRQMGKGWMELLSTEEVDKPTSDQEEVVPLLDGGVELPVAAHLDSVPLRPLPIANDAGRVFQAGTLAVLAVGIATMCVAYL
ncbi:uncharacterized protein Z520_02890 [Fonsecaea multimorphosa CBS 102226]|uniref:Uncharacterized protein n=1 Tax=Fonsecaea multimorphosa CBS 102226 TaxID=1442371 RepID=A0A0D2K682_9EURO|nr:uncharacterized protein Z520_02890 [Fonsecaea multimorphosa CBS 102226]KIY01338.1 hypothetical protein Z520_02890 [Fonsecaea multimorphosa CBS 102226]OAL28614.1 hypothetical protein AYO22_02808 [Fonsecaea multimorphosa]